MASQRSARPFVFLFALLAVPGWAQAPTQPAADDAPEEIVVTAQKREENLADVPLPVQAISAEDLAVAGAAKVSDLVTLIPGASVVSNSTPGFETLQIRGIASGTTGDGLVGYYIDETPFGIPNLQLTPPARLLDIERVEVIRGPSGTLYGQGSMGGTIKLVTARPDSEEFSGRAEAEYSNTSGGGNNYSFGAVVNVPLVSEKLAVRASGSFERLSGYAEAPEFGEENVNDFDSLNLRVAALWTPLDRLDVTLSYWRIDNEQNFSNGLTPTSPVPSISGTNLIRAYTDVDAHVGSLTLAWETHFGTLTSNTSYIDHQLDFLAPLLTVLLNDSTFDTESFTQELRLASPDDGPLHWIGGFFYRDATIHSDIDFTFLGFPVIDVVGDLDTKSWSLFGEISMDLFGGKLVPLVGLRYFEDERGSDGLDRATGLPRSIGPAHYDAWSPRFNLSYHATENGLFYVNVAMGFRSGVLQTQAQADASTALGIPTSTQIDPDELWTYEVGTRWSLFEGSVLLEASYYHTDWEDIQLQFATAAIISLANGGDAKIDGFDAGIAWRAAPGLTLQFIGNWNDAEFGKVVPALGAVLPTVNRGEPLPNVPDNNYTLVADYERELPWGDLTGRAHVMFASRARQIDAASGLRTGELDDLTFRVGVSNERWNAELFLLNALDDDDPAVRTGTALSILYPRRVGFEIGVSF
jgi:outer membrane receptor protein involved in Fe transport